MLPSCGLNQSLNLWQRRYSELLDIDEDQQTSADKLERRHKGFIKKLEVHVELNDQSLNLETDESYALDIAAPHSHITVQSAKLHPAIIVCKAKAPVSISFLR